MDLSQFKYILPENLIANQPASPRDASKLMLVDRNSGKIRHSIFKNLPELLNTGDVLVFNQTKVIPARLFGQKPTGGNVEVLLLKQTRQDTWESISKPGLKLGQIIKFTVPPLRWVHKYLEGKVEEVKSDGVVKIKFNVSRVQLLDVINKIGHMPVPPYIKNSDTEDVLRKKYQTIYAKISGSAAAPTAGLHFTKRLLQSLRTKGIQLEFVTLHVGLGTFRPVTEAQVSSGKLHQEEYILDTNTAERLNNAKTEGKRIIAVGTTTTRVLESCVSEDGKLQARHGNTEIFIYPPYEFKFIDGLITNFHLPGSSLLMLVSALVSKPNTNTEFIGFRDSLINRAYIEAIEEKYRFYSFGDAMLIL